MNSSCRERETGIGFIILLVALYIIFNTIPGPLDDAVVAALGGYHALKKL